MAKRQRQEDQLSAPSNDSRKAPRLSRSNLDNNTRASDDLPTTTTSGPESPTTTTSDSSRSNLSRAGSGSTPTSSPDSAPPPAAHLTVTETPGDLFSAPPNTLLVHACNCLGHWGAGIALAFRQRYPSTYRICHSHCRSRRQQQQHQQHASKPPARATDGLPGTSLLIAPQQQRGGGGGDGEGAGSGHFVGCLFTSKGVGRAKDGKAAILRNTARAMGDLLGAVARWNDRAAKEAGEGAGVVAVVERIWLCRINAGLFGVPWEETLEVLRGLRAVEGAPAEVTVVTKD